MSDFTTTNTNEFVLIDSVVLLLVLFLCHWCFNRVYRFFTRMSFNQQVLKQLRNISTDVNSLDDTMSPLVNIESQLNSVNSNTSNTNAILEGPIRTLGSNGQQYIKNSSKGVVVGGVRSDAGTTVLADDETDFIPFAIDPNGSLFVRLPGIVVGTSGNGDNFVQGDKAVTTAGVKNNEQTTFGGDDAVYVPFAVDNHGNHLVNVMKISNNPISVNNGEAGPGCQRICIANNDDAILTLHSQMEDMKTKLDLIEGHLGSVVDILADVWDDTANALRTV
jgi:hypothetical protein